MRHSECVDHVHFAWVSIYRLRSPWQRTPPRPSPRRHTIARANISEGAPKELDASLAVVLVLLSCRPPHRHLYIWSAQQLIRVSNASKCTYSESSIGYDHSWVRFASCHEISPEASASLRSRCWCAIRPVHRSRTWTWGHARWCTQWCWPAKNSLSRAPHGHLHVNRVGFCVTAPNPIGRLIWKRR